MEEVEGKQSESKLYLYSGFVFHKDKRYAGKTFRCKEQQTGSCKGQVLLTETGEVVTIAEHNHGPDYEAAELYCIKSQLVNLSRTSHGSLRDIFNDVCRG